MLFQKIIKISDKTEPNFSSTSIISDNPIIESKPPLGNDSEKKSTLETSIKSIYNLKEDQNNVPLITEDLSFIKTLDQKNIFINEKEKTISELFENTSSSEINDKESTQIRVSAKTDYLKLNAHRHNIGELGEEYILKKEKEKLENMGLKKYSDNITHTSKNSDSFGYDIISYFENGNPKYIEVKTTTDNHRTPFYFSETELSAMKTLDNYFIYRLYNFSIEKRKGNLFVIDCKKDIEKYFSLEALSYKVKPK